MSKDWENKIRGEINLIHLKLKCPSLTPKCDIAEEEIKSILSTITRQRTQIFKEVREIVQKELFYEKYKPKEGEFVTNASRLGRESGIEVTVRKILKKLKAMEEAK